MAVVALRTLWLNAANNPEDRMSFPLMSALQVTTASRGEFRDYSAARVRYISRPGRKLTAAATLPALDRTQIAWLDAHRATIVCVRDDRGRKFWAVYEEVQVEEHHYNEEGNSSLALTEVTYSEAV